MKVLAVFVGFVLLFNAVTPCLFCQSFANIIILINCKKVSKNSISETRLKTHGKTRENKKQT